MKNLQHIGKTILTVFLILAAFGSSDTYAQKKKKGKSFKSAQVTPPAKKDKDSKKVSEAIKKLKEIDGLFKLYRDSTSGSLKMVIDQNQIDQEFIHWYYIENGVTDAGSFRGQFRGSKIFKIEKYYNKIEFVTINTRAYFDPESPLSRSAEANISNSVLFSGKIEAGSEKEGKYLISADQLFLSEALGAVNFTYASRSPFAFKLGNLSKSKSKYKSVNNYPENTNLKVEYVYENKRPSNFGSNAVTDPRNISVVVQHSLIQVPDNDYEIRLDEPRVGYFTTQVDDRTSTEVVAYRDLVHRWHLKKKNPGAALSEPVTPITWWIENTTPLEWRETIKEAVLKWNGAFEKAGFKNAVVVKIQPDDAEWDAGDLRYNVLRWTSSPNPPFGGYGPSFVNPRTGQILGADIMLEFVFHTNRVRTSKLYDPLSSHDHSEHFSPNGQEPFFCAYGEMLQDNMLFGSAVIKARGEDNMVMDGMKKEAMMQLIMHEVGHTMGLNHNMKSSQLFSPEQLYDKEVIKGKSLTGSIMDYAPINLSPDPATQGHYYSVDIGPYDNWAIEWGYTPTDETGLDAIADRSTQPELIFGNDADDMRSAGKGIDPRVNTGDFSNDQIKYSIDRINLSNELMTKLKDRYTEQGNTYQELRMAFYMTHGQIARAGDVISRFIGGVYIDRAVQGQEGATQPYTAVSYADQKRAMNALKDHIFSPDAFEAPSEIYNYLAMQRRGFGFSRDTEDPRLHDRVISSQKRVLDHILHFNTLQRISDSELYGNRYKLSEFMTDLNNAVFKADAGKSVNTFRQNLQIEYTKKLIDVLTGERYTTLAKSMALYNLQKIRKMSLSTVGNISTKAHRQHLKLLVDKALDS